MAPRRKTVRGSSPAAAEDTSGRASKSRASSPAIKSQQSGSIDESRRKTVLSQSSSSFGTEKSGKTDKSSAKRKTIKSPESGSGEDKKEGGQKDNRRASSRKRTSSKEPKSPASKSPAAKSPTAKAKADVKTRTVSDLEQVSSSTGTFDKPPANVILFKDLADQNLLRLVASEKNAGPETDIETAYKMLRADENIEQRTTSGVTPLVAAAATGNKELVALLLERGADVGVVDSCGENELALHAAARRGHSTVCVLLSGPTRELKKLDLPSTAGWTPLHFAVRGGHLGAVKVLLRAKADAARQNVVHGGDTAIHIAVRSQDADVLEELLDWSPAGAWNIQNSNGETALHAAARLACRSCVSTLLRFRTDPQLRSRAGQTALDIAAEGAEKRPAAAPVVSLLSSYMRPKPVPRRTDARFDR